MDLYKNLEVVGMEEATENNKISLSCMSQIICIFLLFPPPIIESFKIGQLLLGALTFATFGYVTWKSKISLFCSEGSLIAFVPLVAYVLSFGIPDILQIDIHGSKLIFSARILLFFELVFCSGEHEIKEGIKILAYYLFGIIALNYISEILLPNGIIPSTERSWQRQHILANANSYIFFFVIAFFAAVCSFQKQKRPSLFVCVLLIIEACSLLHFGQERTSDTGLLILVVMAFWYLCRTIMGSRNIGSPLLTLMFLILLCIAFVDVMFRKEDSLFIHALLSAGINPDTLLRRAEIWQNALTAIQSNHFLGAGTGIDQFSIGDGGLSRTAHNTYLQVMYYGGIVGLVSFLFPSLYVLLSNDGKKSRTLYVVGVTIVFLLIAFMVEQKPFFEPYLYLGIVGMRLISLGRSIPGGGGGNNEFRRFVYRQLKKAPFLISKVWLLMSNGSSLRIGKGSTFRRHFIVNCNNDGHVKIGAKCFFNNYCSINAHAFVSIGDCCMFGENVKIYDHDHVFTDISVPMRDQGFTESPVVIGDDCWVGSNVVILRGSHIGRGSVVGAGAVVHGDVPPYSVVIAKHHEVVRSRITSGETGGNK